MSWNKAKPAAMNRMFGDEWGESRIKIRQHGDLEVDSVGVHVGTPVDYPHQVVVGPIDYWQASEFAEKVAVVAAQIRVRSFHLWSRVARNPVGPYRAVIDDKQVEFRTLEDKFAAMLQIWKRHNRGKSVISYAHPAYFQIVAMGWPVVSLLLAEVAKGAGTLYPALQYITGEIAEKTDERGNSEAVRRAWLDWGKRNGQWSEPDQTQGND